MNGSAGITVLMLCREDNLCKELWGFSRAFRRNGVRLACVDWGTPFNIDVRRLIEKCPERPSLILQPESDNPIFPWGLAEIDTPTACFQFDTFTYTDRRIRWSMLYDYPLVFHPSYSERFQAAGHPHPLALANAAPRELYEGPEEDRVFDVGWVGRIQGAPYEQRRRILTQLGQHFQMNEWKKFLSPEEMAGVFRRSRIVVNVGRDDYPQDANMRVFEVMAAGALLITAIPTELTSLGFQEGIHFVGYHEESEVVPLVRRFLGDHESRRRITETARNKVMGEHLYDNRVAAILERLRQDEGHLFAPARNWPEERVRLLYLDLYAAHSCMSCAWNEFRHIARRSITDGMAGASLLAKAWARQSRGRLVASFARRS
ncbi:MAG: glycosyltransferase family protein [Candidatus Acidiferrales bacterium]